MTVRVTQPSRPKVHKPKLYRQPFSSVDAESQKYLSALVDPFSPAALGARVPDMFSTPTIPGHIRGSVIFAPGASAGSNFIQFYANPCWCMNIQSGTGAGYTGDIASFTQNSWAYYATTQTNFQAMGCSYRVVGGGILIKNKQPPLSATGGLVIANPPALRCPIGAVTLNGFPLLQADIIPMKSGLNLSAATAISLIDQPSADEYEVQELMSNDILVPFHICDARAFDFRSTLSAVSASSTQYIGVMGGLSTNTTGAQVINDQENAEHADATGWSAPAINLTNFPASTAAMLEIEFIYHVEFIPAPTQAFTVVSGEPPHSVSNPGAFQNIVSKCTGTNFTRLISQPAAHSNARHALAEGGQAVLGMLGLGGKGTGGKIGRAVRAGAMAFI